MENSMEAGKETKNLNFFMCSWYRNQYRNLNWPGLSGEGDVRGVKRIGRDEPIGVVIHICMETTHVFPGFFSFFFLFYMYSLCSYLYLKLAKTSCFSFCFLCFSLYKIREQEESTGSALGLEGWGD
jgi:hypothetical protein